MKLYEAPGQDPQIVFTTEAERRLTKREIISLYDIQEIIDDLREKADEQRAEAIHEHSDDNETLGRMACFMSAGQCEFIATEVSRLSLPKDEELEDIFKEIEEELS